ncbi:hypothetical protein IUY40_10445 [Flavobacterium sp. ALJ2]|uniref:hypothetical protein n=1 Tax=Flavobacterium sp. ALJ2 TaxID=2786960 RepID=UPI00189EAA9B|nr:hypothetical protein [Flavobacterium sp. ALJ2]MBF7091959.1 hypothetical protein [Flavobacterium sp. ALJ2]
MLLVITISCNSTKKVAEQKPTPNKSLLKVDGIYSEELENNHQNLYFFSSKDSLVYFAELKKLPKDSISNLKFATSIYGSFTTDRNTIKIKQEFFKTIKIKEKRPFLFYLLYPVIPINSKRNWNNLSVLDKETITEGEIKENSIVLTKEYLGTNKLNSNKKSQAKITPKNSMLIYNSNLKGTLSKDNLSTTYSALIVSH